LEHQQSLGIDAVEMELFPLRTYLGHPFAALVVLSDRVTKEGIEVFSDQKRLCSEFSRAFDWFENLIHRSKAN
jgi:hypothetical protein